MLNVRKEIDATEYIHSSWSAYHANKIGETEVFRSIGAMLPLFKEESHSPAFMCHAMTLIMKITE